MTTTPTDLEMSRLAASFVEAAGTGDDEQVALILFTAARMPSGGNRLLVVLAGMISDAVESEPRQLGDWVTDFRADIDRAERSLESDG